MPISDLLAQISGDKSSPTPNPARTSTPSSGIKRKTDGDSDDYRASKARHVEGSSTTRPLHQDATRPSLNVKPSASSLIGEQRRATGLSSSKPGAGGYAGTAASGRSSGQPNAVPASSIKRDGLDSASRPRLNLATMAASKAAPARSSPTTTTPTDSKAPKKGSFAEIMARGAKAQQVMPKTGGIQHKALSKPLSKKERMEQRAVPEKAPLGKKTPGRAGTLKTGTSATGKAQNGAKAGLSGGRRLNGDARANGTSDAAPEKKMKKAALATTGYTGTARPAPSKNSAGSRNGHKTSSRVGGLLAPPKLRRRVEDDEDDEEMDDFIDDDEEDEPAFGMDRRPQYDYDSEGSSDMEAGADDIYMEETRAERAARDEDRKEEARLEKLKREKEARKRGYR